MPTKSERCFDYELRWSLGHLAEGYIDCTLMSHKTRYHVSRQSSQNALGPSCLSNLAPSSVQIWTTMAATITYADGIENVSCLTGHFATLHKSWFESRRR